MYFCEIENFAYGEINERSFSNPTPGVGLHGLVYIFSKYRANWYQLVHARQITKIHLDVEYWQVLL